MANPREMAAKLRRPHSPQCRMYYATGGSYDPKHDGKCDPWKCGAEDFNAQVDALLAAIDEEMRRYDDLRRAWPKDPQYVDASPDAEYPERILAAYIDESGWISAGAGAVLAEVLNQAQAERNAILRDAIAVLSAHRARRGGQ